MPDPSALPAPEAPAEPVFEPAFRERLLRSLGPDAVAQLERTLVALAGKGDD